MDTTTVWAFVLGAAIGIVTGWALGRWQARIGMHYARATTAEAIEMQRDSRARLLHARRAIDAAGITVAEPTDQELAELRTVIDPVMTPPED